MKTSVEMHFPIELASTLSSFFEHGNGSCFTNKSFSSGFIDCNIFIICLWSILWVGASSFSQVSPYFAVTFWSLVCIFWRQIPHDGSLCGPKLYKTMLLVTFSHQCVSLGDEHGYRISRHHVSPHHLQVCQCPILYSIVQHNPALDSGIAFTPHKHGIYFAA